MVLRPVRRALHKKFVAGILAAGVGIQGIPHTPLERKEASAQERGEKIVVVTGQQRKPLDLKDLLFELFSPDRAILAVKYLRGKHRVWFFKNFYRNHPKEAYLLVEKYMCDLAVKYKLPPDLVKYIFYRRQFDLRNPLGVEDLNVIKKFAGPDVKKEDFVEDPFLGIEIGVKFLSYLANKYKRTGTVEILTEYLFGPFSSKKKFKQKTTEVRRMLLEYYKNYTVLRDSILVRVLGDLFYSELNLDLKKYKFYELADFEKLSERERKREIYNFVYFISHQLEIIPEYLLKMIQVESGYNHNAFNQGSKAIGLLQIRPILFTDLKRRLNFVKLFDKDINFEDLRNPYYNVVLGAIYFKYCLLNLNNDYESAIQAYNMGFNNFVKNCLHNEKLQEAGRRYLDKVMNVDLHQIFKDIDLH